MLPLNKIEILFVLLLMFSGVLLSYVVLTTDSQTTVVCVMLYIGMCILAAILINVELEERQTGGWISS